MSCRTGSTHCPWQSRPRMPRAGAAQSERPRRQYGHRGDSYSRAGGRATRPGPRPPTDARRGNRRATVCLLHPSRRTRQGPMSARAPDLCRAVSACPVGRGITTFLSCAESAADARPTEQTNRQETSRRGEHASLESNAHPTRRRRRESDASTAACRDRKSPPARCDGSEGTRRTRSERGRPHELRRQ